MEERIKDLVLRKADKYYIFHDKDGNKMYFKGWPKTNNKYEFIGEAMIIPEFFKGKYTGNKEAYYKQLFR